MFFHSYLPEYTVQESRDKERARGEHESRDRVFGEIGDGEDELTGVNNAPGA